jgi:hypothetical protein
MFYDCPACEEEVIRRDWRMKAWLLSVHKGCASIRESMAADADEVGAWFQDSFIIDRLATADSW